MKSLLEDVKNRLITVWKSAKGRTVIISGGSAIAGIILVAVVFANISTSAAVGHKFAINNSASSTSSSASTDSNASSIPVVSAAPAPSNAAPTAADALHTIPVTSVDFNHTSLSLKVGATAQLSAKIAPSDATDKALTWTSTNNGVATVDGTGVITAKSAGTTLVRATNADGQRDTCTVTVTGGTGNAGGGSNNTGGSTGNAGGASNGGGSGDTESNTNGGSGTLAAQYVRVDATHTYTDEITGIAQTVHFQGIGFANKVAGGYADTNTTPEMGAAHYGLATVSLSGDNGINQGYSTAGVSKSGSNPSFTFSNLTAGTYTLQLTAHDGTVVARYHFTVDSGGNVQ